MKQADITEKQAYLTKVITEAKREQAALTKVTPYEDTLEGQINIAEARVAAKINKDVAALTKLTGKFYSTTYEFAIIEAEKADAKASNQEPIMFCIERGTRQLQAVHDLIEYCQITGNWSTDATLSEWLIEKIKECF